MASIYKDLVFDPQLIRRFDVNGPRYTSYPTADRFVDTFNEDQYRKYLSNRASTSGGDKPLSLYVHIPFCNTICYYCGCNKIITKDHGRSAKYLKYLDKELSLLSGYLSGSHEAIQLHFGGGTPTFLSHDEMRRLMDSIRSYFTLLPDGEYSIEVDPRKVDRATVELLAELGFNRMSVGVQDFDPEVQKAVNRIQSLEETRLVMDAARENGFKSISVDLIYGLPGQNVSKFDNTLEEIVRLSPDRLSIYNYAHLPHVFKPQRRINENELPSADEKLQILSLAIRHLTDAGYVFIGMDHFAKPEDELTIAQRNGRLHRNFQGYSTYADCDLLAIGVSSIGKVGASYCQSYRTMDEYYDALDAGRLPIMRGLELNEDDVLRRAIIQALMCHFEIDIAKVEREYGIDFASYFAPDLADLQTMAKEELISLDDKRITVLPRGRMLVRVIAMAFDRYLRYERAHARYSKVI